MKCRLRVTFFTLAACLATAIDPLMSPIADEELFFFDLVIVKTVIHLIQERLKRRNFQN